MTPEGRRTRRRAALCLWLLAGLAGVQAAVPSPPLSVPFDAGQAGQRIVQRFEVEVLQTYSLQLVFSAAGDRDAARLHTLLRAPHKDGSGVWVEEGVPATFRARITREGEAQALLDAIARQPKSNALHGGRYAQVVEAIRLPPGRYVFELTVIDTTPELSTLATQARLVRTYLGK